MKEGFSIFVILLVLAGIFVGIPVGYYEVLPWFYNKDTQAVRESNQYVFSEQRHLMVLLANYNNLQAKIDKDAAYPNLVNDYRVQQKNLVEQMRELSATLNATQIPPSVNQLIQGQ